MARTGAGAVDIFCRAVAARRGHPQCACCALDIAARAEVARRGRRGESLRAVSDWLVGEGHAIRKDGVANHLRKCVGVVEKPGDVDQQTRAVLVATAACDVLQRWPGLAQEVADRLRADGLGIEADVVLSDTVGMGSFFSSAAAEHASRGSPLAAEAPPGPGIGGASACRAKVVLRASISSIAAFTWPSSTRVRVSWNSTAGGPPGCV